MAPSKIFELCIMRKVETQFITSDNQFGSKREHGTDLCIFTVKSVINIITCIIVLCIHVFDASKAYDRVNHWTLFLKIPQSINSYSYC